MKQIVLTIFSCLAFFSLSIAQGSNLVVFNSEGDKFFLILNGVRQNEQAETNVKVTGLIGDYMKAKVIFENESYGFLEKNVLLTDFDKHPQEVSYNVKRNNKGVYVMNAYSAVPLAQAPPPAANVRVIEYHTEPFASVSVTTPGAAVTTTTTTQSTTVNNNVDAVSMGVNVNGLGLGMNVNIIDGTGMGTNQTTTTYSQTTTTSTYSSSPTPTPAPTPVPAQVGCTNAWPMNASDFSSAKTSISSKGFDDSRLTVAKQILNTNCLTSAQVKEICALFSFEDTKLDFAKFAYGKTTDPGNYFKINDVFSFESSIEELNTYIGGR